MNYPEALTFIESLSPTLVRPGLERFRIFMQEHGDLQDQALSIHVGGTNGKGSVASILAETLKLSGYKTGKYTGPHLLRINERYDIDGKSISDDRFAELVSKIKTQSESFAEKFKQHGQLTWYELLTAVAFYYFAAEKVDAKVIEVGLGGQYDASNIMKSPLVSCIVSIGLDHTHILGDTVEKIAAEKAGIARSETPLFTACGGEALKVIKAKCEILKTPLICSSGSLEFTAGGSNQACENEILAYLHTRLSDPALEIDNSINQKLNGYQRANACLSAGILAAWEQGSGKECLQNFGAALESFFWPGRLQFFPKKNLIMDGAHNPDGALALRKTLDQSFPESKRCFVLAFYKSKDFEELLNCLLRPGDTVYCSEAEGRRAVIESTEIVRHANKLGAFARAFDSIESAFAAALSLNEAASEVENPEAKANANAAIKAAANTDLLLVACGSFAVISTALKCLGYASVQDSKLESSNLAFRS